MKKALLIVCIGVITLSMAIKSYAQETSEPSSDNSALIDADKIPYERTPLNKLGRGLINTVTCLVEVPAEAYKVSDEKDPLVGCTLGVAEGFVTALLRGLTGLYDTVTFVIPPYNKPIMQPEYALDSAFDKFRQHPNDPADKI
jgi:putative exosortase-associated protein (TIGR04073 family)